MKQDYKFEWEFLDNCQICDHDVSIPNGKINYLKQDFWYVVCTQCNTKYMNPRPTKVSYDEFYKNFFWEEVFSNNRFRIEGQIWNYESKGLEKVYQWNREKINRDPVNGERIMKEKLERLRVENIENILAENLNFSHETRILEIGAGIGVTLNYLNKKYNCEVDAIEPSLEACKSLKENTNINIIANYAEELSSLSSNQKKYDCIIFAHSLENTLNPVRNILEASKLLNKNGFIYIQCSNLFTFDQMNPYHPYIFSLKSFKIIADLNGFKVYSIGSSADRMLNIIIRK
jgi:2-polyprenyl-3-methyl-5-hydroxy-6-metoxy-1,4-benzoquinol methylase